MTNTIALIAETSSTIWFKIIVVTAFLVTIKNQARFLPKQNILTVVFLTGLISAGVLLLGEETGVPFAPFFYTENLGWRLFYRLPWLMPFLWIIAILNSRDVSRLILRPWRETANYGWWVISLSGLLMVIFDANLEPFATRTSRFWIWETQDVPPIWYAVPWMNFIGVAATSLFILGLITPWLINKKPAGIAAPNHVPLFVWILLMLFLTGENALNHLQLAARTGGITIAVVTLLAWLGSRK
jgi:uncharacterized membrane protein